MGQEPINEGRQMASKIKIVKIGQYTVFPRGVVGFFQEKKKERKKWQECVVVFWQERHE